MRCFHVVHEFEADPDTFWELYFDASYTEAFFGSVNVEVEVLEQDVEAERPRRRARYRSNQPLASFARRLAPQGLGFDEEVELDRAASVLTQHLVPTAAADRTEFEATMKVEPLEGGRVRRTYSGTIDIRIPVIGGPLEQTTVRAIERSQDQASAITRRWLALRAGTSAPTVS